ncbi:MAG: DcaP family trimeric outer membrane transporter [Pseudomonadota bacterium]
MITAQASCDEQPQVGTVDLYPSSPLLPENVLRLYLYFPREMGTDITASDIVLLDDAGTELDGVFLPTRYGLWTPDRRRLTVLLDPGRVKSGLKASHTLGKALEAGRNYLLRVPGALADKHGCPLGSDVEFRFKATGADISKPAPETWRVSKPRVGTRDAVIVDLGSPHDHVSMAYRIRIHDASGIPIAGEIRLSENEHIWHFAPTINWSDSGYEIAIDNRFEDLAGNRPSGVFDRNIDEPATDSVDTISFRPIDPRKESLEQTGARQEIGRVPDDAIVRAGDFTGSIVLPGTTASVRIGGYVQADMGFDFDSLGFSDALNLRTIPLDGTTADDEQVFRSHARYSRLNIDVRDQTPIGQFRTFIEFDFFGSGSTFTNNYTPVLRHAAAGIGNLYFGQYWSQFTDLAAFPEGTSSPLGQPIVRNPGVRWRSDLGDSWRVAFGIEDPAGDLSGDSALLASDSFPNLTGYGQLQRPWGHVRLALLGLKLESTDDSVYTGGAHLSGRVNFSFGGGRDNLAFSVQAGSGFAHYYATLANSGLEGLVADDGSVESTDVLAGYLAYQHWWSNEWRSTVKVSSLDLDGPSGSELAALQSGRSYGANIFWTPVNNVTFGLEYIYAESEVISSQQGSGSRLSGVARFDF